MDIGCDDGGLSSDLSLDGVLDGVPCSVEGALDCWLANTDENGNAAHSSAFGGMNGSTSAAYGLRPIPKATAGHCTP